MNTRVEGVREIPICVRCGGPGLMACSLPQPPASAAGERTHVLCEHCDIDDPAAGALVAFMTVHVPVPPQRAGELASFVHGWVASLAPCPDQEARPDREAPDAEWEAYRLGDFDGSVDAD